MDDAKIADLERRVKALEDRIEAVDRTARRAKDTADRESMSRALSSGGHGY